MNKKFAYIDFINKREDIPINPFIKKNMPNIFLKWYLKNKNIFLIEETQICDEIGYYAKILVPKEELYKDEIYTNKIIDKTLQYLKSLNVGIVNVLNDYNFNYEKYFYVSSNENIMPFFIPEIIEKTIKITKKEMKNIKILVIGKECNKEDVNFVLDIIYPNINYLYLLIDEKEKKYYKEKEEYILGDTGLILQLLTDSKSYLIKEADIIINISDNHKLDNIFKKGSIYIDLSNNKEKLLSLASKREDVLCIDNIKTSLKKEKLLLKDLDMYIFLKLSKYRHLNKYKNYYKNNIKIIREYIIKNKINIISIGLLNKWISTINIERFLNKSRLL